MSENGISVVIPTYNCAPYLDEAVRSVLEQSCAAVDLIVVDDGSTDATPDVIRSFGDAVTGLRQDNQGVSHARNKGAAVATGAWLLFLDADDLLEQRALERLLDAAQREHCGVAYGDKLVISEDGAVRKRVHHRDCTGPVPAAARACFHGAAFEPAGAIVRTEIFHKVGGFRKDYEPCEDRFFWIQCGCLTSFAHVHEVVYRYRRRSGSHSTDRIGRAVAVTRMQIDLAGEGGLHGFSFLDPALTPVNVLNAALHRARAKHNWKRLDALLKLSDALALGDATTRRIKWRRRYYLFKKRVKALLRMR